MWSSGDWGYSYACESLRSPTILNDTVMVDTCPYTFDKSLYTVQCREWTPIWIVDFI